jgi:hypothetical protein
MRFALLFVLSLFIVFSSFGAPPPPAQANARTIRNLSDFPLATLKLSLSPRLYKSLIVSPLTAWVVVNLTSHGRQSKIIHSEAGGVFDSLALAMAKGWEPSRYDTTESRAQSTTLNVHLLVYKIADGLLVVNFAHNDQAAYAGIGYTDVYVGVIKDGKLTRVGGTKVMPQMTEPYR